MGDIRYSRSFHDRWLGFRSMLEEQDVELEQNRELLELKGINRSEMTEELDRILKDMQQSERMPTSFVCANDSIAICVMTVLMRLGIDVPSQCSVFGFDNIEDAGLSSPTLSTVHVNKEALGQRSVETLLWRIAHPDGPKEKILLAGDFVLRESTTAAPQ
ncbi:substrate-binding domain-containing protein [Cohnella lupini]|uniref:substrate-binding domain-containing protein n=1 Tax=Cohnella lupini TaxID=1294267 RepID=UPI00319D8D70